LSLLSVPFVPSVVSPPFRPPPAILPDGTFLLRLYEDIIIALQQYFFQKKGKSQKIVIFTHTVFRAVEPQ
ncbi:MAG: hypothetical protein LBT00_14425, partial [Spirochaetaceae bacterium]|nr:hypothetical protein [Spirochaetaceae bacterium]